MYNLKAMRDFLFSFLRYNPYFSIPTIHAINQNRDALELQLLLIVYVANIALFFLLNQ
jgi:hypothetical protein